MGFGDMSTDRMVYKFQSIFFAMKESQPLHRICNPAED
jgi:hypothetical protein